MIVTKPYLYIEDEYQRNRAEWILGFSCLSTASGPQNMLPRFGTASINQITDEPYTYLSPIDLKRNNEALLALLWRYRGKMDIYVVNCLNILLEIIVENKFLSEYMFNSDPPTYEYARFTDWFRPYLNKELEKARRNMAYRHSPKKEEWIVKCFSFMDVYDSNLIKYEQLLQGNIEKEEHPQSIATPESTTEPTSHDHQKKSVAFKDIEDQNIRNIIDKDDEINTLKLDQVISWYPKRYIIGCTTKVEEIMKEEIDGIIVTTYKVYTEYVESQPTLSGNKTQPSYAFHNSKVDADQFDLRNYHQSNLKQAELYEDASNKLSNESNPLDTDTTEHSLNYNLKELASQTDVTNDVESDNIQDSGIGEANASNTASEWNLPKKIGDVVILITANNTTGQTYNLRMNFCCDDDLSKENIKAPVNDIETLLKPYFNDMWMCVHKVFPEKDWGQFHIEWSIEEKQKEAMPKNMVFGYSGREIGDDMDDYTHVIYGPSMNINYYSFV